MCMRSSLQKMRLYLIITHQQGGGMKGCRGITSLLSDSVCLKVTHGILNKTLLCSGSTTRLFTLKLSESL